MNSRFLRDHGWAARACAAAWALCAGATRGDAELLEGRVEPPDPASASAPAQSPDAPADPRTWSVQFEPQMWFPALRGDIEMPGGSLFDVETLDLDEPELSPAGELSIRGGDWIFQFNGFAFDVEAASRADDAFAAGGGAGAVAVGDRVEYELDYGAFEFNMGKHVWSVPLKDADDVAVDFDLYAGARAYALDLRLETGSGVSSHDAQWADALVGMRMRLDLPHGFGLETAVDVGGGAFGVDGSFSWDITVAFTWVYENTAGIEIGFRHLSVDTVEGEGAEEFEFDNALAGLFGAVVIRF